MSEEERLLIGILLFIIRKDGNEYMPLVEIAEKNNTIIDIYDSLLSEGGSFRF